MRIKLYKDKAKKALNKKAKYGPDVDIKRFIKDKKILEPSLEISEISKELEQVGIDITEKFRAGSYYQINDIVLSAYSKVPGLKVLSLEQAYDELGDELWNYYWKAVPVDADKFTATVELVGRGGYIIIAKKNSKITMPVQTCLFMYGNEILQAPHNIIIAEEGSELTVITGCTQMRETSLLHAGVSEFYIERGAKVTFIMIHSWARRTHVRPRTGAIVKEGGEFVSHYINLNPVQSLQTYPNVRIIGDKARANVSSIVYSSLESYADVGAQIFLGGRESRGEIISRGLLKDNAKYIARAKLIGANKEVKGHIECNTLLLSDDAIAMTIPKLEAFNKNVALTHEAAIGKLSREHIQYLIARGFSEREAISILVRGFMKIEIRGLPESLMKLINQAIDMITKSIL